MIYGDGSVIRDFIYIDDAINAILKIADGEHKYRTYNVGSGYGTSIADVLKLIQKVLNVDFVRGKVILQPQGKEFFT